MTFNLFGSNIVECNSCNAIVSVDAKECPHCGANLTKFRPFGGRLVECNTCDALVSADAIECPHCGADLTKFRPFGGRVVECNSCDALVSADAAKCPHCSADLTQFRPFGGRMIECHTCDTLVSADATKCPHCGADLTQFKPFGGRSIECSACHKLVSEDAAECPNCGKVFNKGFFGSSISVNPTQTRRSQSDYQRPSQDADEETSDTSSWIIKIIFYLALIIGAIWLAFAVVLPLLIINIAAICLIYSFIYRQQKMLFGIVSFLGAIFIVADYNKGWLTKTLVENVHFFEKAIPFFLYLNLAAGLIACYFLTRDLFDEYKPTVSTNEFSKRNLIIMGSILAIGATTILVQNHFDPGRGFGTVTSINNSANLGDANTPTQYVPANSNNGANNHGTVTISKMDSTKIADSTKMADSAKAVSNITTSSSIAGKTAVYNSYASNVDADSISLERLRNSPFNTQINNIDLGDVSLKAHLPYLLTITPGAAYKFTNRSTTRPLLTFVSLLSPNTIKNEAQAFGPEDFVINLGPIPISPGTYIIVSDEDADITVAVNNQVVQTYNAPTIYGLYPQGSTRLLLPDELRSMSKQNLKIMRNEIFARHGFIFKTDEMKMYFAEQSWYKPAYEDVTKELSSIEKENITLIQQFEK